MRLALQQFLHLFVDDGWLALATLCIVVATAAVRCFLPAEQMLAGALLLLGCYGAFVPSVLKGLNDSEKNVAVLPR
jgi:hypothetical protein